MLSQNALIWWSCSFIDEHFHHQNMHELCFRLLRTRDYVLWIIASQCNQRNNKNTDWERHAEIKFAICMHLLKIRKGQLQCVRNKAFFWGFVCFCSYFFILFFLVRGGGGVYFQRNPLSFMRLTIWLINMSRGFTRMEPLPDVLR